jgi:hypothetical protein
LERSRKAEVMDKGLIKLCAILPAAPDESLAYKAKKQRFDFISGAGVHDLGIDLAESVQAGNSAKHLLTHQLAVPHKMAMQFMANARQELSAYINSGHKFPHRRIEAARMAATSARLIDIFQRGLLTLDRLRNGGRQKGTVQHVNVNDSGQAVVAQRLSKPRQAQTTGANR